MKDNNPKKQNPVIDIELEVYRYWKDHTKLKAKIRRFKRKIALYLENGASLDKTDHNIIDNVVGDFLISQKFHLKGNYQLFGNDLNTCVASARQKIDAKNLHNTSNSFYSR